VQCGGEIFTSLTEVFKRSAKIFEGATVCCRKYGAMMKRGFSLRFDALLAASLAAVVVSTGKEREITSRLPRSALIGEASRVEAESDESTLQPDPILRLRRIIGLGSGSQPYPDFRSYR